MRFLFYIGILCFFSCKKSYSDIYAISDLEQVSLKSDTCLLASISSTNYTNTEEILSLNYVTLTKGYANRLTTINNITNSTRNRFRVFINDTLSIYDGDSIFLDKATKYVKRIATIKRPLELEFDQYEYRFFYKDSLLELKLMYVNGDTIPYYESRYNYANNQLEKIEMYFKPENKLIFQSAFKYEKNIKVKPWIYYYSDFFSLSEHLLVFNFGAMPTAIVTEMESVYFDNDGSTVLGLWKTVFSNYKISKDNYVLRAACFGQRIQSLPYLFQNIELKYQCKN
jgi:hypothetical protein